jgi:hypothetical protein
MDQTISCAQNALQLIGCAQNNLGICAHSSLRDWPAVCTAACPLLSAHLCTPLRAHLAGGVHTFHHAFGWRCAQPPIPCVDEPCAQMHSAGNGWLCTSPAKCTMSGVHKCALIRGQADVHTTRGQVNGCWPVHSIGPQYQR